jgi:hypothetical protein
MAGLKIKTKREVIFKKGDMFLIAKKKLFRKTSRPYKIGIYAGIRQGKDRIVELTRRGWKLKYMDKYNRKRYNLFYGEDLNKDLSQLKEYKFIKYK